MSTVGRRLLSSIVYSSNVSDLVKLNLGEYLFRDSETLLYKFLVGHILKFGVVPSPTTIEATKGLEDALTEAPEPPAFYLEEVEKRYLRTSIKSMVMDTTALLQDENDVAAYDLILDRVSEIHRKRNRNLLLDFREAMPMVQAEYKNNLKFDNTGKTFFGWPTLDTMTSGLRGGDVCSFIGRPSAGKTFKLLYVAHNAWKHGQIPLFVSMEMNSLIIMQRLAAMHNSINMTQVLTSSLSTAKYKEMITGLKLAGTVEHPFWVVDGNMTSTVEDIIMLCRQLSPSAVFVDGAYMLRHPNPKVTRFDRITENAEWLKQRVSQDLGVPTILSYQFSREVSKKKKKEGEKAGVEDIYGSDTIGQVSSIVLGLMEQESIETMHVRRVEIMKGRNGEAGEFRVMWDFNKMDFREYGYVPKDASDHQDGPEPDTVPAQKVMTNLG